MKKTTLFSALFILITLTFFSCDEQGDSISEKELSESVSALDLDSEAAIESGFEDVDMVAEAGFDLLDIDASAGSRVAGPFRDRRDLVLDCATITKDTVNHIITIDFGDGCEGPHGVVRKGKIIITYSGNRHEYGATRTVTLEDFYVDSLHVEGTRVFENLTTQDSPGRVIKITMTGGKITFPDGTFATRDAEHIRTRILGETEDDDRAEVTGDASGVRRDGQQYTITIVETLIFKRVCWEINHGVAVAGVIEIVIGDKVAEVDFGDGTCDNEVTVTIDGETTTRTIDPRGRRLRR
ncbi:hypothetical protein [Marinoscillum sp. MHG1-6]|uniref:hypothetical protein n=1 Tax=Marinoscillum sp. MHG1-6 TaxID=2959627 RepID=UPI002157DD32|nr:hypothetical protein [Marinoscillum sp. MHG1-6]